MNNAANKITVFRIILIPVFMFLLYIEQVYWALAFYIIACVSDFFDGQLARSLNQVTDFGKFMDPLADKMLVVAAMCYFVDAGTMPGWLVALVLVREFAVSGLRLIAAEQGKVIAAAFSGKVKTFASMIALGILIVVNEPWVPFKSFLPVLCSAVILITTLYSGAEYFIKNYSILKDSI